MRFGRSDKLEAVLKEWRNIGELPFKVSVGRRKSIKSVHEIWIKWAHGSEITSMWTAVLLGILDLESVGEREGAGGWRSVILERRLHYDFGEK